MALRWTVLILAGLEAVLWLAIGANGLFSRSDPATRGLDQAAALIATAVFALSGLPALVLAARDRFLPVALGLTLFPVVVTVTGVALLLLWR
ncbi:hypothetical protein E8L99_13725 [Phreatobacter aquaticus]|uniref:Uncharacterized protein n=1 Tax=Phreatobacter aquaticus TaxID=2570229 RepID=A0A4D7QFN7_9HYPH|nr:hypothetical protein [Phreatobacter aquaticus]QCK86740.1 hypothetical protein E8L99_13725 [Phreatobacter aquaticus]